jgi:hypothetical protein
MVKVFLSFFILATSLFSDNLIGVEQKIKSLLEDNVYEKNKAYIDVIFSPKSNFIVNERVDSVKIVQTLKDNGLLSLYFDRPKELRLNFHTSDNPLFFVKMMGDALRNIGYYRYVTKESNLNQSGFTWSITLKTEYVTDPQILQRELSKSGSKVIDVIRLSETEWTFDVDMRDANLAVKMLNADEEIELERSLYAYWLDVSKIKQLRIKSSYRNSWYPYIAYFDPSLHLLKIVKRDTKRRSILLNIPQNAKYIKISDIYTLKNIKDSLFLTPIGKR